MFDAPLQILSDMDLFIITPEFNFLPICGRAPTHTVLHRYRVQWSKYESYLIHICSRFFIRREMQKTEFRGENFTIFTAVTILNQDWEGNSIGILILTIKFNSSIYWIFSALRLEHTPSCYCFYPHLWYFAPEKFWSSWTETLLTTRCTNGHFWWRCPLVEGGDAASSVWLA